MGASRRLVILFLAANPRGTAMLALDREARAIQDELDRGHARQLVFETRWAVTPVDVLRVLRKLRPSVVHFAGHGEGTDAAPTIDGGVRRDIAPGNREPEREVREAREAREAGLIVHDGEDGARVLSSAGLTRALGVVGSVRVVVLNACYSAGLAEALLPHVDCVVGMSGAISDVAARAFSAGFYGALADGDAVSAAWQNGKAAIGLEAAGLAEAELPQLRSRRDHAVAAPRPWRRAVGALGANLRLGAHATGALGIAAACVLVLTLAAVAWRAWFAFGESALDVRVRQLVVRSSASPQPVQEVDAVRAVETTAATLVAPAVAGVHRVALTGGFLSINYARAVLPDPACQARFAVIDAARVEIERATPEGRGCDHEVVVVAGRDGLELAIDGAPAVHRPPYARITLRMAPGAPVVLVVKVGELALFRPSDGVVWPATRLEATADRSRVHLPGGLRDSDTFELDGAVELRELRFDAGQLAVAGALRSWSGRIGRAGDWDSAAPWPPSSVCWSATAALVVLALAALVRARLRWHAWEMEPR